MKRYLRYIIPAALVVIIGVAVALFLILPGEETGDTNPPDSPNTEQPSGTEEAAKHKMHDYFVLDNGAKPMSFSTVTQYEGTAETWDMDHGILVLRTEDLDTENMVIKTFKVYDLASGEVLLTKEITYPFDSPNYVEMSVKLDYPIVRFEEITHFDGEDVPTTEISYYFAKKDSEMICYTNEKNDYSRTDFDNGLSAIRMAGKIYWIDRNMEIIRSVNQIAVHGYDVNEDSFQSEYEGYLYSLDDRTVQVFNRLGVCSGEYRMAQDGYLNAFVLNNGNVLIQEFNLVESYENYDVKLSGSRYVIKNYIMNFIDGALTPIELDFIVEDLETAYGQENDSHSLPFDLAKGKENQAIIYKYANGTISLYQQYVVLTNDLTVEYAVQNNRLGVDFFSVSVLGSDLYSATVCENGGRIEYVFDLNGNALTPITTNAFEISASYIVTPSGVYNHKMEMILNLTEGKFAGCAAFTDTVSDRIYISKHNYATHATEGYVLTPAATEPVLLCDGLDAEIIGSGSGFYTLKDSESNEWRFYNLASELKLAVGDSHEMVEGENLVLVEAYFEGRPVIFVIR